MNVRVCACCKEAKPLADFYDPPRSYCRQCSRQAVLDWRKQYPGRREAHQKVANALKYGELIRPNICERCGMATYTYAHHEDYRKPLQVQWLCDSCHAKRHAELKRSRPRKAAASRENGKKGGRPKKKRPDLGQDKP